MKNILGILVIIPVLLACENSKEVNPEVPEDFINNSLEIFSGSVIERKSELEDGIEKMYNWYTNHNQ